MKMTLCHFSSRSAFLYFLLFCNSKLFTVRVEKKYSFLKITKFLNRSHSVTKGKQVKIDSHQHLLATQKKNRHFLKSHRKRKINKTGHKIKSRTLPPICIPTEPFQVPNMLFLAFCMVIHPYYCKDSFSF